jgi:SAM-dependent methyltransferase
MQARVDRANAEFWNELCGSTFAKSIGVKDHSPASLQRFDDAYFAFYPYLLPIVRPERWSGKSVLEIGLGYGSLSQRLAEAGANYRGLDIAENPVRIVRARLARLGKAETAAVGTALALPFASGSFDAVISIGCLHHTGDRTGGLKEVQRVLRSGGSAIVMVYNKYSFRQWSRRPMETLRRWREERKARTAIPAHVAERAEYDANAFGMAAPETVMTSAAELRDMFASFEIVRLQAQNCDPLSVRGRTIIPRKRLLSTVGRLCGLDLYCEAVKPYASATARRAA